MYKYPNILEQYVLDRLEYCQTFFVLAGFNLQKIN